MSNTHDGTASKRRIRLALLNFAPFDIFGVRRGQFYKPSPAREATHPWGQRHQDVIDDLGRALAKIKDGK